MELDKQVSPAAIGFRLDVTSGVPPYLQIVRQVEDALRLGYLSPGDQLPRVKDVVASLAINPNTVLKAYRDLEHKGLVAGKPGQGTFIERSLAEVVPVADQAVLGRKVSKWIADAAAAGLDDNSITALFTRALSEYRRAESGDLAS
jgi:GntR family transcriptional regulator